MPGHLAAEFALSVRESFVCLGAVAWRELAGGGAPFQPRRAAALDNGGLLLYPMYHPAYIVRGAYAAQDYMWDFMRLRPADPPPACQPARDAPMRSRPGSLLRQTERQTDLGVI